MAGAKIVFLSKGEGNAVLGQRPIAILPMLYRLWARIRLREAEDMGCAHPADFEHGGVRGRSAMEAAFEAHPSGNHHCVEQSSNEGRPVTVVTWVVPVPHESHGPRLHNFGPHAGAPCTVGEAALMGAHHPGEPCCLEWYPAAAILERMSGSPLLALTTSSMRTSLAVPLPERQPAQQQAQVGPPEPPQSAAVSLPSPGGAPPTLLLSPAVPPSPSWLGRHQKLVALVVGLASGLLVATSTAFT